MFQVSWISKYFWNIVLVGTGKVPSQFSVSRHQLVETLPGAGSKDLVPVSTSISSTSQGLNCSLCDMRCVLLCFHTATQQGNVTPSWGEPHRSQPTEKQQQPWSPNDTDRRLNCAGAQRELWLLSFPWQISPNLWVGFELVLKNIFISAKWHNLYVTESASQRGGANCSFVWLNWLTTVQKHSIIP